MKRRILHIPDKHDRYKDISTLKGYREVGKLITQDLIHIIKEYNITDIHGLGDLFDSGYSDDQDLFYVDILPYIQMNKMVNGNFREVVGNHINKKTSTNPELCLISPNPKYKIKEFDSVKEPMIHTPDYINIEGVNFYFQHYNWDEVTKGFDKLSYHPNIVNNGCKNVAYFHTDYIAPGRYCKFAKSTDVELQQMYKGLDLVFTGHIHQPIEPYYIGNVMVINPGSLANTRSDSIHAHINLPILEVENGNVNIEFIENFDLHTEKLIIQESKKVEIQTLRSNKDVLDEETDIDTRLMNTIDWLNKKSDMPELDQKLCRLLFTNPNSIEELVKIYQESQIVKEFSATI